MVGRSKKNWSKAAMERKAAKLLAYISEDHPDTNDERKKNLARIKEDFKRY